MLVKKFAWEDQSDKVFYNCHTYIRKCSICYSYNMPMRFVSKADTSQIGIL